MLEVQEDRVGQTRRQPRRFAFNGQRVGFCFLVHSGDIQQCSAQADSRGIGQLRGPGLFAIARDRDLSGKLVAFPEEAVDGSTRCDAPGIDQAGFATVEASIEAVLAGFDVEDEIGGALFSGCAKAGVTFRPGTCRTSDRARS